MPPRKRDRAAKTPSPPDPAPDPARKPSKQRITSSPVSLAPKPKHPPSKPPQQDPPASRQSTTLDASGYATHPTSYTQGRQAGGLSGAGLGYGVAQPDTRLPFAGSSAFGYSAQQPLPAVPLSPYHPRYGQDPNPPHNPSSGSRALPPPPPSPYSSEKKAMYPPVSDHRLHRGAPALSPHATRAENSPPTLKSQSEAPPTISENAALIQFRKDNMNERKIVNWMNVSKDMKTSLSNRDADWCKRHWHTALDPSGRRAWSPAEDAKLKELKGESTDWDWEVIASEMEKHGFYRDAVRCRMRWQEVLVKDYSGDQLTPKEKKIIDDLESKGKGYPEIIDALERQGFKRKRSTLANVKWRSQCQE